MRALTAAAASGVLFVAVALAGTAVAEPVDVPIRALTGQPYVDVLTDETELPLRSTVAPTPLPERLADGTTSRPGPGGGGACGA